VNLCSTVHRHAWLPLQARQAACGWVLGFSQKGSHDGMVADPLEVKAPAGVALGFSSIRSKSMLALIRIA